MRKIAIALTLLFVTLLPTISQAAPLAGSYVGHNDGTLLMSYDPTVTDRLIFKGSKVVWLKRFERGIVYTFLMAQYPDENHVILTERRGYLRHFVFKIDTPNKLLECLNCENYGRPRFWTFDKDY